MKQSETETPLMPVLTLSHAYIHVFTLEAEVGTEETEISKKPKLWHTNGILIQQIIEWTNGRLYF